MKKYKIQWIGLVFGILWFLGAILIFMGYTQGWLGDSFSVPRIVSWAYDWFGVTIGSIIQLLIGAFIIFISFEKQPNR